MVKLNEIESEGSGKSDPLPGVTRFLVNYVKLTPWLHRYADRCPAGTF